MEQAKPQKRDFRVAGKAALFLAIGLLLIAWLFTTPGGLLGKADAIGYSVCHRIDARSFHLGERQLPVCARCSGMFLGALLGLLFQAWIGPWRSGMPPWKIAILLGGMALAFGVDGLNSYLHFFPGAPSLYEPQNWLRLVTGTGMGLGIAALLYPAYSATVWSRLDERPALDGWLVFGKLVLLAALLDLLVLTENPLILYPLALLSAGSVLGLLMLIYSMMWIMLFRLENRFSAIRQLIFPLAVGFGMALIQIALIDLGRYWLTGTWGGFVIG